MKEQDFIPERARFHERLTFASAKIRGAAAAAASATGAAMFALVLAVLPPLPGAGVMTAMAQGSSAAALA